MGEYHKIFLLFQNWPITSYQLLFLNRSLTSSYKVMVSETPLKIALSSCPGALSVLLPHLLSQSGDSLACQLWVFGREGELATHTWLLAVCSAPPALLCTTV